MELDRDLLKVYSLFDKERNRDYYAWHALNRLYLDLKETRKSKYLKTVRLFLSDHTIHPYLMLYRLSEDKANEIVGLIFNDITKNLFPDENFSSNIIRRVENPSKDIPFMKDLLSIITSEKRDKRFNDPIKAKELFYLYGEKEHLRLVIDGLETYSKLYHDFKDSHSSFEG
ncbi:MAG: hypothetical protein NTZ83_06015 [Candidatus Pacearchaeota archaeon]|nr:hypothetical protein [Candidatus Pacearchaeota archaeon]